MTAITAHDRPHTGIWQRATRALGKLRAMVLALPEAPAGALRRKALPPAYYDFAPF
ncbi:MAG TPA: hypothetical protein VGQ90_09420 [Stellaceae bacterium]|jgi:hypothetical protein|nr:hypothetical protein [Stellaceae bacterium]